MAKYEEEWRRQIHRCLLARGPMPLPQVGSEVPRPPGVFQKLIKVVGGDPRFVVNAGKVQGAEILSAAADPPSPYELETDRVRSGARDHDGVGQVGGGNGADPSRGSGALERDYRADRQQEQRQGGGRPEPVRMSAEEVGYTPHLQTCTTVPVRACSTMLRDTARANRKMPRKQNHLHKVFEEAEP